jgi:hypothetical protein
MFKTKLQKRIEALEEFLGIIPNNLDSGWVDYSLSANEYTGELRGFLGKLFTTVNELKEKKK